jgi:hypothetical protein
MRPRFDLFLFFMFLLQNQRQMYILSHDKQADVRLQIQQTQENDALN